MITPSSYVEVGAAIVAAARSAKRDPDAIRLLAVSKGQEEKAIQTLIDAGQRDFGESYIQEALPKILYFAQQDLTWHFIGRMQSNKAALVAQHFTWVHSLSRLDIAKKLSSVRSEMGLSPLQVCVQVNVAKDPAKDGLMQDEVADFCHALKGLPSLRLRGLMTILAQSLTEDEIFCSYEKMTGIYDALREGGVGIDTLSMGMSQDFAVAIKAGANMVRIGRALFGPRS